MISLCLTTSAKAANDDSDSTRKSHGLGAFRPGGIRESGDRWETCVEINIAMDLEFQHPTDIYSLAACRNNDALDLVAIGGDHSVEVVQVVRESQPCSSRNRYTSTNFSDNKHLHSSRVFSYWFTYNCACLVVEIDLACNK